MQISLTKIKIGINEQKIARKQLVFIIVSAFFLLLALFFFPITEYSYFPPCPWNKLTNTFCPGCGFIRGLQSVIDGNIFGLLQNNPLAMIALPFLGLSFISLVFQSIFGFKIYDVFITKSEILLILFIIVIYWIIRNFLDVLAPIPI